MKTKLISLFSLVFASSVIAIGATGCTTSPPSQAAKENLSDRVDATLAEMKRADPDLQSTLNKSAGYAIFPDAGKDGAVVGASFGRGEAYQNGAFSQTGLIIGTEPNTSWNIIATPDLDGDGKSDLLWRNQATGQVYGMLMNGNSIGLQNFIYTSSDLAWKIVAVGDYNGDGKSDLLWRNESTGQLWMMQMNGLAIGPQAGPYFEPNLNWRTLGPWEYGIAAGTLP